jgi:hypothetical protein
VWLDVEKLGQQGLYADIADGLKNSKSVVAFISEEYSDPSGSGNCLMELLHAMKNRKLPVIVCIVGLPNKDGWMHTQVGMLVGGCNIIFMQSHQDFQHNFKW